MGTAESLTDSLDHKLGLWQNMRLSSCPMSEPLTDMVCVVDEETNIAQRYEGHDPKSGTG